MWKEIKKQFEDELKLEDNEKDKTFKKIIIDNLLIKTSEYYQFKKLEAKIDTKDCKIDKII